MKANQKFMEADEGVSPVIGVILMVAITVVLAAVVFVLVSDLGETKDQAPNISFQKDATNDRLRIVNADEDADWSDIVVVFDGTGCGTVSLGGSVTGAVTSGQAATAASNPVTAGDFITFSGGGPCEITLRHSPTNSLYDTWSFS